MIAARVLAASLVCAGAGCMIGGKPERYQPAAAPEGVSATVALRGERFDVELLALDDTALIVRRLNVTPPVAYVRYASIRGAKFNQVGILETGRPPDARVREKLRLVSRFPQGLSADLLRELLTLHGQTEPVLY